MVNKKIVVEAGKHSVFNAPICATVPLEELQGAETFTLVEEGKEESIAAQIEQVGDEARLWWIEQGLSLKQSRVYELVPKSVSAPRYPDGPLGVRRASQVAITEKEGATEVKIGEEFLGSLYFGKDVIRPYFHPIMGPFGSPVTRGFPMIPDVPGETRDHPHHKAFFVAHGEVNGTNNWSDAKDCGRQLAKKVTTSNGAVFGKIEMQNEWVTSGGEKVIDETRTIRFFNLPPSARLIDLMVHFKAEETDVTFGDTKEGGICSLRLATTMDVRRGGRIENSFGGVDEAETWGKRAHWCDYSGPVGGNWVGVAIFDHPHNLRYPTYWHVRNYGLMTANCFGLSYFKRDKSLDGSFLLKAGQELIFRYRIYVHPGNAQSGRVAEKYNNYINPPEVSVE